jgi:ComF family protein
MKKVFDDFLQAVLPARCPVSGAIVPEPGLLAPDIWGRIDMIGPPICTQCGVRFDVPVSSDTLCPACLVEPPAFDAARSVFVYNDQSREMVLSFKHADQTHLVRSFVPWMARAGAEIFTDGMIVVPVPLHRLRLFRRRYNQSALLAQGLARHFGTSYRPDVLVRVRSTPSQGHLTRVQRFDNVTGAFQVPDRAMVSGVDIMLIDDVFTTGATVEACARELKRAGARRVVVLTLARAQSSRPL